MLTVNLISAKRAEQLRYRRIGGVVVRTAAVVGLVTLTFVGSGFMQIRRVEQEISQTNLAKIAYQEQALEVQRLRVSISALEPRTQMVKTSHRRLDHWRYLYSQVSHSIPEMVRVESIDIGQAKDGVRTLKLLGRGDTAYDISKTLLALNTQPGFSDVVMNQVVLTSPHEATLNAELNIKPLPEDVPAAPAATPAPGAAPGGTP